MKWHFSCGEWLRFWEYLHPVELLYVGTSVVMLLTGIILLLREGGYP